MSEGAHTAGPWAWNSDGSQLYSKSAQQTIMRDVRWWNGQAADRPLIEAGPELLEAIKLVRSIISEAAATGFNCHDGDWAERLFKSQAVTHAAVRKAEALSPSPEAHANG